MIRITHYRYKCIGCAYCAEVAPLRWQMSELDGKSDLVGSVTKNEIQIVVIEDDELYENEQAASLCPVKCIKVEKLK